MNLFAKMQRLGKALMLPIAVLPVAGLLLRLGQPDVLDIVMMAEAGKAIFSNLPLLFAIGVAVGLAKDNNGTAALAGAIGYLAQVAVMKSVHEGLDMGVLGGLISGIVAGLIYNRFKDIKLPEYLAFFGGKRFVPIITVLICLVLGIVFAHVWLPVQEFINGAGELLKTGGSISAFIFGVLNRILIVTGLHHIINSLAWFLLGSYTGADGATVTGDLHRFFAGDPSAGIFMAGFFPVMMFGLPAACLAMYHEAREERRAAVGGMLLSMAFTCFLTGISEPIEFTFLFLAPVLYAFHALLTGLSMAICQMLDIHLGFTFSAGAIDYVLSYGLSSNGWMAIPLGLAYGVIYYGLFRFFIRVFNIATPGREVETVEAPSTAVDGERGQLYIIALGGAENLVVVDACTTRLRLSVQDASKISESALKQAGARGVLKRGSSVQVIIGPEADIIAGEINRILGNAEPQTEEYQDIAPAAAPVPVNMDIARLLVGLGGSLNIKTMTVIASTRLRIVVRNRKKADIQALTEFDAVWVKPETLHVICGPGAEACAQALRKEMA